MDGLLSLFERDDPLSAFSAHVLGLVAEDAVRAWCRLTDSPYEARSARPTLKATGEARGHTIDFLLRRRGTEQAYVTELKAWPAFEGGRYAVLDDPDRIDGILPHGRDAMEALLQAAHDPASMVVTVEACRLRTSPALC